MSLAEAVRADLPATTEAPGLARGEVRGALSKLGLDHLTDEAELIASEITTNAVIHGRGPIRLCVYEDAGLLFVEVEDGGGEQEPALREPDAGAESGRGLEIVEALAADWGVEALPGGVRVWASLETALRLNDEPADPGPSRAHTEELVAAVTAGAVR